MPSFRLTIAYDGTDFAGSQVQPDQRTVQGELERALAGIAGAPVVSTFAGRTDRGVHAAGQIAAVCVPTWRATAEELGRALNANLPRDIGIIAVDCCDAAFNPRFEATWREYRYWVVPGSNSPFLRRYAWLPRTSVSVEAVEAGASWLIGTHDFATFAGGGEGVPWSARADRQRGTTRTIMRCEVRQSIIQTGPGIDRPGTGLEIRVAADGFLPRMVRNIVGALVEVGQGRQNPLWIGVILAARDRRAGSVVAPPEGLTLWRVGYGDDPMEDW